MASIPATASCVGAGPVAYSDDPAPDTNDHAGTPDEYRHGNAHCQHRPHGDPDE
jgi:hypothetical protein